jgi:hypothetical protein
MPWRFVKRDDRGWTTWELDLGSETRELEDFDVV